MKHEWLIHQEILAKDPMEHEQTFAMLNLTCINSVDQNSQGQ